MTHICVGKLNTIGSDNGLSPGRRQAIIWTNAGILSTRPLATNFNDIVIGIQTFSFKKMYLKMSSVKWCPFCLGLNVLRKTCEITDRQRIIEENYPYYIFSIVPVNGQTMLDARVVGTVMTSCRFRTNKASGFGRLKLMLIVLIANEKSSIKNWYKCCYHYVKQEALFF